MNQYVLRCGALISAIAVPAFAQTTEATPAQLPPVIVSGTAQARSELDMPAAVAVIDAQTLSEGQPQLSLAESLVRVPGIAVRERNNDAQDLQIQSRGFGARSSFGVRGLQLRLDGIPVSAPDGQGASSSFLISSLDRIEILRGPLAYAYGNASGGVISAWSVPTPDSTQLRAAFGYGSDETWRTALSAGGALAADRLGYRAEVSRWRTDGNRPHSAAERTQVAGQLNATVGAEGRVQLLVSSLSQPDAQDPLGLTREQFDADPSQTDSAAIDFNTSKSLEERALGLRYTQPLSAGSRIESVLYGTTRDVEQFLSIPASAQAAPGSGGGVVDLGREGFGAELRYVVALADWTVSLGVQAQQVDEDRRGYENFVGDSVGVRGALRRDEDNKVSGFDQVALVEWTPSKQWLLVGAVRHSSLEFESDDRYIAEGNPDDSGSRDYSRTTPALSAQYRFSDKGRVYASWGQGFETPTVNELSYRSDGSSGLNFALDAARSETFELGLKQQIGSRGLATLVVYETRTEDEIVPATNSGGRTSFQNAQGGTERRGAEVSVDWVLTPRWSAYLAADYLDATFRESFTYNVRGESVTVDADNRLPGVARRSLYGEFGWNRHTRDGFSALADVRYVDDVQVDDVNSDAAASYTVTGLRLIYTQPAGWGHWRAFVRGENLFDREYAGSVIVNESNGRFFEPGSGRGVFAGLEIGFAP
ncbi:MAG: TonB-dependent receptor [Pseudomonadota bacterium]|nr:TonB-dependent receptor [Pseudomonadota bacterium]